MRLVQGNFQAFTEIVTLLTQHRDLTLEMTKRDISDRYAGQAFGLLWALGHPVFMIGLYVFVFSFVFKTKIGGTFELPLDYTTYMLSGLVAWIGFQESMAKSCTAITSNASLVKQVVFPLEILPVKGVVSALFQQIILIVLLLVYVLISQGIAPWTYLLLPVLFVLQMMAMIGVAYLLSAIGTYFRDIKDIAQLLTTAGVYLLPVFYLPTWVPPIFKPFLYINPFSSLIWCYQDVLYFGRIEHPWAWGVNAVASFGIFVIGYRIFRKLKPGFGNRL